MKILLTGASSYVGARLFFDLSKQFDVIGTFHGNQLSNKFIPLDITDESQVKETFSLQKPDIIIHVAANPNPRPVPLIQKQRYFLIRQVRSV